MALSEENNAETQSSPVRDLVIAAQRGDMKAFGQLYALYSRMVHGALLSRVPPADAEDMVQEVFMLALRKLKALKNPDSFGGWLLAITRNRASDFHRDRTESVELTEGHGQRQPKTQALLLAEAVLKIIQELPEAYRDTLVFRLVEGMTGPEIAERTGLSHGSVRVNLHRGMELLRQALRKEAGE
jgi:RNA polymerase sigma-70 factor, ECF subfamily